MRGLYIKFHIKTAMSNRACHYRWSIQLAVWPGSWVLDHVYMWPDRMQLRTGEVYIDRQLLTEHGPGRGLDLARHCRPARYNRLTAINDVLHPETQSIQRRPNYFNEHTCGICKVEWAALHPRQWHYKFRVYISNVVGLRVRNSNNFSMCWAYARSIH